MTENQKLIKALIRAHKPENLPRLPYYLKEYEGEEEAFIEIFCQKYQVDLPLFKYEYDIRNESRRRMIRLALTGILVAVGLILLWLFIPGGSSTETQYVIASGVHTRTSPNFISKTTADQDELLRYGEEVKVIGHKNQMAKIQYGFEGYIRWIPEIYLGSRKEYLEMNAIFDHDTVAAGEAHSFHKRALLDYFEKQNYMGSLSPELQKELYGDNNQREIWHIEKPEGFDPKSGYATLLSANFTQRDLKRLSKSDTIPANDLALILKRPLNGDRKLLMFTFDSQGKSRLMIDAELPENNYIAKAGANWDFPGFSAAVKLKMKPGDDILKVGVPGKDYIRQFIYIIENGEMELYTQF